MSDDLVADRGGERVAAEGRAVRPGGDDTEDVLVGAMAETG
jgi:hypothetical protein